MNEYLSVWSDEDVVLVVNSTSMTSRYHSMSVTFLEDIAMRAAEAKNVVGIAVCGDISSVYLILFYHFVEIWLFSLINYSRGNWHSIRKYHASSGLSMESPRIWTDIQRSSVCYGHNHRPNVDFRGLFSSYPSSS